MASAFFWLPIRFTNHSPIDPTSSSRSFYKRFNIGMDTNTDSLREAIRLQLLELQESKDPTAGPEDSEGVGVNYNDDSDLAIAEWTEQLNSLTEKVQADEKEGEYDFNVHRIIKQPRKRRRQTIKTEEETKSLTKKIKSTRATEIPRLECGACLQNVKDDLIVQLECNCRYCKRCFKQLVNTFLKTKEIPQCCNQDIKVVEHRPRLSIKAVHKFKNVKLELATDVRLYCGDAKCAWFIKPWKIKGDYGACCRCKRKTCVHCKNLEMDHSKERDGKMCPLGSENEILGDMVEELGFKRCPHCFNMVEKNGGCNHIACKCGKHFCYGCGEKTERGLGPCKCNNYTDNGEPEPDLDVPESEPEATEEEEAEEIDLGHIIRLPPPDHRPVSSRRRRERNRLAARMRAWRQTTQDEIPRIAITPRLPPDDSNNVQTDD